MQPLPSDPEVVESAVVKALPVELHEAVRCAMIDVLITVYRIPVEYLNCMTDDELYKIYKAVRKLVPEKSA
jgi:hypothetical protein